MADNPCLVNQSQEAELTKQSTRKKYETPQVIYSAPLEAMAAACDPASGGKTSIGAPGCTVTARS